MEQIEVETELLMFRSETSNSAGGYIRISGAAADAIRIAAMTGQWADGRRGNFGSAKVTATIGGTSWPNAVFPEKGGDGWYMPVKLAVRKAEGLTEGDRVTVRIEL